MKRPVSFSSKFTELVARGLVGVPNGSVHADTAQVLIGDILYSITVDSEVLYNLSQIHGDVIDPEQSKKHTFCFLAKNPLHDKVLELDHNDLRVLFFTVDKVIAGADPVSIDGELSVRAPSDFTILTRVS